MEGFQLTVIEQDLEPFGTFYVQTAGREDKRLRMDVFVVKAWQGGLTPDNGVEEILCIDSTTTGVKIESIFEHEVLPRLKTASLIN